MQAIRHVLELTAVFGKIFNKNKQNVRREEQRTGSGQG